MSPFGRSHLPPKWVTSFMDGYKVQTKFKAFDNMINEMNYHKNIYDFFRSKKQFMIVPSSVTIVTKKSAI